MDAKKLLERVEALKRRMAEMKRRMLNDVALARTTLAAMWA